MFSVGRWNLIMYSVNLDAGVAWLSSRVGLQYAMLIVPTCYAASGVAFLNAERIMENDASSAAAAMKRQGSRKELGQAVPGSLTEG